MRNYQDIVECITPYAFREDQPIALAMIEAFGEMCQELEKTALRLAEFWDIDQEIAGNLERIGRLFALERRDENAQTFKAKILTRIFLDKSSGTYPDINGLFDSLIGAGNWTVTHPSEATLEVNLKSSITTIPYNFVTSNQDNLVTLLKDNLIVLLQDPTFLSFLATVVPAGVLLNIIEAQ